MGASFSGKAATPYCANVNMRACGAVNAMKKGARGPFFHVTHFFYLKVYVALNAPLMPCGL